MPTETRSAIPAQASSMSGTSGTSATSASSALSDSSASQPSERNTRQRDAIRQAILQAERPLSTQEILEAANQQVSGIGIATVYRNVKAFLQSGDISAVAIPGDSPRYEIAGSAHHHHFHCTNCDRMFDVHHCPGDFRDIAPRGFRVDRHEITLHGLCSSCLTSRSGATSNQAL